jgi:hypothetical protein
MLPEHNYETQKEGFTAASSGSYWGPFKTLLRVRFMASLGQARKP